MYLVLCVVAEEGARDQMTVATAEVLAGSLERIRVNAVPLEQVLKITSVPQCGRESFGLVRESSGVLRTLVAEEPSFNVALPEGDALVGRSLAGKLPSTQEED